MNHQLKAFSENNPNCLKIFQEFLKLIDYKTKKYIAKNDIHWFEMVEEIPLGIQEIIVQEILKNYCKWSYLVSANSLLLTKITDKNLLNEIKKYKKNIWKNFKKVFKNNEQGLIRSIEAEPIILQDIADFLNYDLKLKIIERNSELLYYFFKPDKKMQQMAASNIKRENLFYDNSYYLINDPISLIILYNKTTDIIYKEMIKKNPNYKDNANLILEVINE